jgi:hypothetical protein
VSLAERDTDLAICMVSPEGARLYARKLSDVRPGLFAFTEYLLRREASRTELKRSGC